MTEFLAGEPVPIGGTVEVAKPPVLGSSEWLGKCVVCMLLTEDGTVYGASDGHTGWATETRGSWELCRLHAERFDRLREASRLTMVAMVRGT